MNNILCKIGLHKRKKVKSTKTTRLKLMEDILKKEGRDITHWCEEMIYRRFRALRDPFGYDIYDVVCIKCSSCSYNIDKVKNQLIKDRNSVLKNKKTIINNDRRIENMYKGCK